MTVQTAPTYTWQRDWEQLPAGWTHPDVAGVAVDSHDRVYLFCRGDHPLIVLDRDGRFISEWPTIASLVQRAHGITIGPDDAVFLTDDLGHTVRKFSADGQVVLTLGVPGQGSDTGYTGRLESIVRAGPPFNRPTNLSVAANGDLYVSDGYGNARVHHFAPDGRLIRSWGTPGLGDGKFNLPHGVCVLGDGRVLVADRENDRISVFSSQGEFHEHWDHVQRPTAITTDGQGRVFVTELTWFRGSVSQRLGRIEQDRPAHVAVLDQAGHLLSRWGDAPDPTSPGALLAPHGIAVDSRGDVYVAEVTRTFCSGAGREGADSHTFQKFAAGPASAA